MGVDYFVHLCTQQQKKTQCTSSPCSRDSLLQSIPMQIHKKRHKKVLEQSQGENSVEYWKQKTCYLFCMMDIQDGENGSCRMLEVRHRMATENKTRILLSPFFLLDPKREQYSALYPSKGNDFLCLK